MNTIYSDLLSSSSSDDDDIVELWFPENTWQYNLINDKYVFKKDNESVLKTYGLYYLKDLYQKVNNNYMRNKHTKKLVFYISEIEWDHIKCFVK